MSYVNPQTCSRDEDEDRLLKVCKLTSASQIPLENLMSHLSQLGNCMGITYPWWVVGMGIMGYG